MTKLGEGIGGIFSPSAGAYVQILPVQMEAAGYDESKLGLLADLVVLAGMWAEFVIPALIVLGLFTRAASLAMIGFILVMSVVDIAGHGADAATVGMLVRQDSGRENPRPAALLGLRAAHPHSPRRRPPLAGRPAEARERVAVMKEIGACEARKHLSKLLDRVVQGESLTITRHGRPVARLVPVAGDRDRAREAAVRIFERRRHVKLAPVAQLMKTVHEGHCY